MSGTKDVKNIYENFVNACALKNTYLTTVIKKIGRASGNIGQWKNGSFPRLDLAMDIADYLGISIDELCYGRNQHDAISITDNEAEWLEIVNKIPADKQQICKDFLRTHAVMPDKYADKGKRIS